MEISDCSEKTLHALHINRKFRCEKTKRYLLPDHLLFYKHHYRQNDLLHLHCYFSSHSHYLHSLCVHGRASVGKFRLRIHLYILIIVPFNHPLIFLELLHNFNYLVVYIHVCLAAVFFFERGKIWIIFFPSVMLCTYCKIGC